MSVLEYTPAPSVEPFLTSDKFQNFIVGPVGSAKTTASIVKIAYEASRMAPCRDGIRRSRCVVVRNTRQMLWDTTIPDFLKWFPNGDAGILYKTDSKFLLKLDGVECEVLFRGLDDADDVRRLLSLQLSFGVLDEFREINPDVFNQLTSRLGRYPDGMMVPHRPEWGYDDKGNPIQGCVDDDGRQMKKVWGATNPPDRDTFWEQYLSDPPDNCHVTIQPSGLSPEADWVRHLPSGYYEDIIVGKTEEWIDVYVHGKWGKSLSGMPVFRCFDRDIHVAKTPLIVQASTLIVGVDAGLNPTAVITQPTYNGRVLVHKAITGTDTGMGALRFIREKLKPTLAAEFAGKQAMIVIDPAAFQRAQTDERTVADIYKAEGFMVKPALTNTLAARLAVVESYMTRTVEGQPALLINASETELIKALAGKYRYKINTKGVQDDVPEKSHPWSDYCFVAGTPVLTPSGPIPIEMLDVGDAVCVEDGVDVISAVGLRKDFVVTLSLSDGSELTCTYDHPFAVKTHTCYIPADELTSEHELVTVEDGLWASGGWRTRGKRSWFANAEVVVARLRHQLGAWRREKGSTVAGGATQMPGAHRQGLNTTDCGSPKRGAINISGINAQTKLQCPSTGTYGSPCMEKSPTGAPCTTETETQTTTTSTTSNCCREENTRARIWWSGTLAVSLKSLMQRARLLLRGMGPTKGARGIVSTEQKSPLTVVRRDYLSDDALVFNLTTSRTHTYYAGPALVHNCDGLQYACLQHDGGAAYGMAVTTARREIKPAPLAWARC